MRRRISPTHHGPGHGASLDSSAAYERYRALTGDWEAFVTSLSRPIPACVVANTNRILPAELAALLHEETEGCMPIAWVPGAFRLPPGSRPGLLWPAQAGLYQVQEEASLLPVRLLDPRAGERVLDLCAAPGSKAARICMALGNRGHVIANDRDSRRLSALRDKMKRLGLLNLTLTAHDGIDFPREAGPFDRVLVDAPCSAEGTNFRRGVSYLRSSLAFRRWIGGQQRALLRRAVQLTRPGGRIVYATCSFAPEENEAVVSDVLQEFGEGLRSVPPCLDGLAYTRGVVEWQGQNLHPGVADGVRLWPHVSGTGGFFAIALERRCAPSMAEEAPRDADAVGGAEVAEECRPADAGAVVAALCEWFGLPAERFTGLFFWEKGKHLHVCADDHRPPVRPGAVATGIPLARRSGRWPKPTTAAALLFGEAATRNVMELDGEQTARYQARRPVHPRAEQLRACAGRGYVLLRHRGWALGTGLLRNEAVVEIESQFPRAWVPQRLRGEGARD